MRILSVSSSRADVGILNPVWTALAEDADCELHILLTGMHMAKGAASPSLPEGVIAHRAGADLGGGSAEAAAVASASNIAAAADSLTSAEPDLLFLVGDRMDMLPAAVASLPFNLPIVHLHGGERSEGAIDDRIRHALTKLAHVHCAATNEAAKRIAGMGEESWRIHVTGAPGLDSLLQAPALSADQFAAETGLSAVPGLRLVTVHPESLSTDPAAPLTAILTALDRHPAPTLFTAPNSDPGGAAMQTTIDAFVAARPWAAYRDTLGPRLFANALRLASLMIGNSSSGIIEAGLFGLPVINVGVRQFGRTAGANVHDCASAPEEIARLMGQLADRKYDPAEVSLYGDGRSGPRIAKIILDLADRHRLLAKRWTDDGGFLG